MPALQSPWFAPHVIIYMFSYAILGAATLIHSSTHKRAEDREFDRLLHMTMSLFYAGVACFTLGMLMGHLGEEAWGHYGVGPKRAWMPHRLGYMVYIHSSEKMHPPDYPCTCSDCFYTITDMLYG